MQSSREVPVYRQGSLEAVMTLAAEKGINPIALPAMGIGIFRVPILAAAENTAQVSIRHAATSGVKACLALLGIPGTLTTRAGNG